MRGCCTEWYTSNHGSPGRWHDTLLFPTSFKPFLQSTTLARQSAVCVSCTETGHESPFSLLNLSLNIQPLSKAASNFRCFVVVVVLLFLPPAHVGRFFRRKQCFQREGKWSTASASPLASCFFPTKIISADKVHHKKNVNALSMLIMCFFFHSNGDVAIYIYIYIYVLLCALIFFFPTPSLSTLSLSLRMLRGTALFILIYFASPQQPPVHVSDHFSLPRLLAAPQDGCRNQLESSGTLRLRIDLVRDNLSELSSWDGDDSWEMLGHTPLRINHWLKLSSYWPP